MADHLCCLRPMIEAVGRLGRNASVEDHHGDAAVAFGPLEEVPGEPPAVIVVPGRVLAEGERDAPVVLVETVKRLPPAGSRVPGVSVSAHPVDEVLAGPVRIGAVAAYVRTALYERCPHECDLRPLKRAADAHGVVRPGMGAWSTEDGWHPSGAQLTIDHANLATAHDQCDALPCPAEARRGMVRTASAAATVERRIGVPVAIHLREEADIDDSVRARDGLIQSQEIVV